MQNNIAISLPAINVVNDSKPHLINILLHGNTQKNVEVELHLVLIRNGKETAVIKEKTNIPFLTTTI